MDRSCVGWLPWVTPPPSTNWLNQQMRWLSELRLSTFLGSRPTIVRCFYMCRGTQRPQTGSQVPQQGQQLQGQLDQAGRWRVAHQTLPRQIQGGEYHQAHAAVDLSTVRLHRARF